MAWGVKQVSVQRLAFVMRAEGGKESMTALCREFEISRPTGYLWLERSRQVERLEELGEQSRRPQNSPRKTSEEAEQKVVEARRQRPDWGARKLQGVLAREQVKLPVVTIHRILLRCGMVRKQDRPRQATQRFERAAPNQLWQMDFKGMPNSVQDCVPWTLLDDHSRFLPALRQLTSTKAEPVRACLADTFREHGQPEAMLFDHGTPWWNHESQWGWTWLSVWIMRQGIRLILSGKGHPQTQGKVERFHKTLEAGMFHRPKSARTDWQTWLDAFRQEYNHVRPHEALAMRTPAERWHPSPRPYLENPPAWSYASAAGEVLKVLSNGCVRYRGHHYFVGRAFTGQAVQLQPLQHRLVVMLCRTPVRELDPSTHASHELDWDQSHAQTNGL